MTSNEPTARCDIRVGDSVQLPEGGSRTFKVGGVWWDRDRKVWRIGISHRALGVLWHSSPTRGQVRKL